MRFISNRRVLSVGALVKSSKWKFNRFEKEDPYSVDLMLAARIPPSL